VVTRRMLNTQVKSPRGATRGSGAEVLAGGGDRLTAGREQNSSPTAGEGFSAGGAFAGPRGLGGLRVEWALDVQMLAFCRTSGC